MVHQASPFIELCGEKVLYCVREFRMVSVLADATFTEIDVLQHAVELYGVFALVYTFLQILVRVIFLLILSLSRSFHFLNFNLLFCWSSVRHNLNLRWSPMLRGSIGLHRDMFLWCALKNRLFDLCTVDLRRIYDYICHRIYIHADVAPWRVISLFFNTVYMYNLLGIFGWFTGADFWTK